MQPNAVAPKLEDISAARAGHESFTLVTLENALHQLRTYGLVVLRNAFRTELISDLLDRTEQHSAHVYSKAIASLSDYNFDETYRYNPKNLGCDLTAIDPWTSRGRSTDFTATSLYAAIMSDLVRSLIVNSIGEAFWTVARVRVVIPGNDGKAHGRLSLHTERCQIDKLVALHNIWTPLVPEGIVTNVDCPGIQFYVGRLSFFEKMSVENKDEVIQFLATMSKHMVQEKPNLNCGDFFFRPKLRTGDVVIFSGAVPHTAYVPPTATRPRVNFDVRIFGRSEIDPILGPWGSIRPAPKQKSISLFKHLRSRFAN
jgi:hypothetical protein